jgi:hypothetical protein
MSLSTIFSWALRIFLIAFILDQRWSSWESMEYCLSLGMFLFEGLLAWVWAAASGRLQQKKVLLFTLRRAVAEMTTLAVRRYHWTGFEYLVVLFDRSRRRGARESESKMSERERNASKIHSGTIITNLFSFLTSHRLSTFHIHITLTPSSSPQHHLRTTLPP